MCSKGTGTEESGALQPDPLGPGGLRSGEAADERQLSRHTFFPSVAHHGPRHHLLETFKLLEAIGLGAELAQARGSAANHL